MAVCKEISVYGHLCSAAVLFREILLSTRNNKREYSIRSISLETSCAYTRTMSCVFGSSEAREL